MQAAFLDGIQETLSPVSLAIAVAALVLALVYLNIRGKGLPPGPVGLPYFGYFPFMRNADCHLQLDAMKKKYGDVFIFGCTGRTYINVGSIRAAREAFITKSDCFGDRVSSYSLMNQLFGGGVVFINGEPWKAARKFFLHVLRERGTISMKNSIAGALYDSIKSTINDLKAKKGEPVNLVELLTEKCGTIMRLTLFGETGVTEEQIKKFNELYAGEIVSMTPLNMLVSGTFAKYFIFPFLPHFSEAKKSHKEMVKLIQAIIDEHRATFDPDNLRDIIDEYLNEKEKRRSKGDPTAEYFTDATLVGSLLQFLGDGILGVGSVISYFAVNLLNYPEEEEKLFKEIVEVIGVDRQPTIEDKSKLTYFNAYLLEAMRTSDFFTVFPSQECTKETTLGGYRIPKGTILLTNFYSIHYDPEVYEEPKKFNPSRFIQTDGKKKSESPIMFGMGKRSCLGEGFVMMQAFLLLATLIQNFHLKLPEGANKVTVEEFMYGNILVCANPRETSST